MKSESCGNCRFGLELAHEEKRTACRRYPPTLMYQPVTQQAIAGGKMVINWSNQASGFPQVHTELGWCGEYQAAPPKLAIDTH